MNASSKSPHPNRLMVWAALPLAFVLSTIAISILGSSTSQLTPPPFEVSKHDGSAFSARDQP